MHSNLKQQIIDHLTQTKNFLNQSEQFNTSELTIAQRQYKEPFGMDQMTPEQWLNHIYIDYAILALSQQQYEIFANIEGFSYFFEYSWREQTHQDFTQALNLIREYEQLVITFLKQQQ
ncbi:YqcC family protein [Psittacicella gerlachiana]|uniref:YqcC-like domain-containing protein n=1 Tax=Psittacicella gerlachiana TaxID=2028574 RepID=A0A3A1YL01_9GAMM|nr:YqcC family protein [Psittacicella gerlachiana]RIY38852.1 hypothetical protein CKF59_00180 [Psittacicella gerlachiana]